MPSTRSSRLLSPTSSFDYLSSNVHSREATDSSYSSLSDDSSEDEIVWSFSELSSGMISPAPRSQRALSPGVFSEEEYIVLSRPRSPSRYQSLAATGATASRVDAASINALSHTFGNLSVRRTKPKKTSRSNAAKKSPSSQSESPPLTPRKRRGKKRASVPHPSPAKPPTTQQTPSKKGKKPVVSAVAPGLTAKKADSPKAPKAKQAKVLTVARVQKPNNETFPVVDDVSEAGDARSGYDEAVQYVT